jgi:predicted 3-demethylubiquinone-9 3-methyltransferase (glyoxalase superfamily)
MENPIYPCLWFNRQAKEAAELYCSVFKNSKITEENPLVVMWELNGLKVMGLNGGPMFKMNPSISLFVLCETIEETDEVWNKLIEGGKAMIDIGKHPWSERYGWLQDKFGFTWQISVVNNKGDKMRITPSFLFTDKYFGKAEAAVKLYTSIFKNSKVDMMMHYPKGDANEGKVLYSEFKLDNYQLIAMDGPGAHKYHFDEGVSLVIECDTQKEIDYYWEKLLANGGKEDRCGWLKDQFGVSWQVVPKVLRKLMSDPSRRERVTAAFMKMVKFNIKELENA